MIKTVLFDLDGTLLDTAPDLAYALNAVREQQGLDPLSYETIRPVVSHGGKALIQLGFNDKRTDEEREALRQSLLDVYANNIAQQTRLFDGMQEVLEYIESTNMKWGVVTNKPGWLTNPLMDALELSRRSSCIVSGDTTDNRKPHPEPMEYACRLTGSQTYECIYIGDAERDIIAGKQAGMKTLVANYGYIPDLQEAKAWGADDYIDQPIDIIQWLKQQA